MARPRTQDSALRRIFGPRMEKVTRVWRKWRNEEIHDLSSSPNNIRVIKSRNMRWTEYVARMRKKKNTYGVLMGKF
jgi:hypothetical protein